MVLPPLAIAGPDQDATVVPSFSEKTVVRPHPEEHRERSFSIDTRKTVYASLIVRSGVKGTLPPPARPVIGRRPHSQYGPIGASRAPRHRRCQGARRIFGRCRPGRRGRAVRGSPAWGT